MLKVFLPAFSQSVVAEMQNELMKRVRLLSDFLLLFLLNFGLGFLWKHQNVSVGEHRGHDVDWKSGVWHVAHAGAPFELGRAYLKRTCLYWEKDNNWIHWQHADKRGQSQHIHTENTHVRSQRC